MCHLSGAEAEMEAGGLLELSVVCSVCPTCRMNDKPASVNKQQRDHVAPGRQGKTQRLVLSVNTCDLLGPLIQTNCFTCARLISGLQPPKRPGQVC